MITTKRGDMIEFFTQQTAQDVKQAPQVFVHGCNSHGVMGSGIAKCVREKLPGAYEIYRQEYEQNGLMVGDIIPWVDPQNGCVMINAITQQNFGSSGGVYVDYLGLRKCFQRIQIFIDDHFPGMETTLNFPLIGCGLGGGDWHIVSNTIDSEISDSVSKILWKF